MTPMMALAPRTAMTLLCAAAAVSFVEAVEIDIDFDEPRYGPVCVSASPGDVLHFSWDEYHNLHELPHYDAYEGCDFSDAVKYADAAPNPTGVSFTLDASAHDRYFSCSKICASNGHKVHVCIADDGCACDEPLPTALPTQLEPTASSAPTFGPTSPAPTPLPEVDAACGDSTSWRLLPRLVVSGAMLFLMAR